MDISGSADARALSEGLADNLAWDFSVQDGLVSIDWAVNGVLEVVDVHWVNNRAKVDLVSLSAPSIRRVGLAVLNELACESALDDSV